MKIFILRKRRLYALLIAVIVLFLAAIIFIKSNPFHETPVSNPLYYGNTTGKAVALMLNADWGEDVLPDILDILQSRQVKVTFFVTGRFAGKFPELIKRMAQDGHELGNHGFSHPHADKLSLADNLKELSDAEKVLGSLELKYSKIFAPPYGEHKEHVLDAADQLGYRTIMWSVDTLDWQEPAPETIIKKVLAKADNGALILMHPKKCTLSALPAILDGLKAHGYQLNTVTEILR